LGRINPVGSKNIAVNLRTLAALNLRREAQKYSMLDDLLLSAQVRSKLYSPSAK
jgi:hypothetical protein